MSVRATTAPPPPPTSAPASVPEPVGPTKRWTTAEFDDMVRSGIIREGSRAFLWGGETIEPMSENQPHVHATMNLLFLLMARITAAEWTVNVDKPLEVREGYKPQPDLTILRGPRERYRVRVPGPADVAL